MLKDLFYLNKDVSYLNNGSFGACPKIVMSEYQRWQIELENQPVEFVQRRQTDLLAKARLKLSRFVGSSASRIVFVANATTALNMVAHSIDLQKEDEVLTTDLEYGAMDRMWEYICLQKQAKYIRAKVNLPLEDSAQFTFNFWKNVNHKTKAIFLSHITSTTALLLPIHQIVQKAKEQGIITIIDGAHAPGHIPLNLSSLSADFYTGNIHKWLFAPKSCAFLYASKSAQLLLKPFIISWGHKEFKSDSAFIDEYQYQGTRDVSAFLSTPAALDFHKKYCTPEQKKEIYENLKFISQDFKLIFGTQSIVNNLNPNLQFYAHPLPKNIDAKSFKTELYNKYKIEIPISYQNGLNYLRISLQIYNTDEDVIRLMRALKELKSLG